jgi:putative iron-dependent peroxidase
MFVGHPPGNYDRILDFSVAATGGLFFAPSADFLDDLPDPPGITADPAGVPQAPGTQPPGAEPSGHDSPSAGSLGVGSLKRSI